MGFCRVCHIAINIGFCVDRGSKPNMMAAVVSRVRSLGRIGTGKVTEALAHERCRWLRAWRCRNDMPRRVSPDEVARTFG